MVVFWLKFRAPPPLFLEISMKQWFALDWWVKQSDGEIFRFPTEYFDDLDQCQARQRHLWTLKPICTVVTKMQDDPDLSKPFLDETLKPI